MPLDNLHTQHEPALAANDIALPPADDAAVQAMVAAVRERRRAIKEARSIAIQSAAPKAVIGFRDARSASDSPWALRFRSAGGEPVVPIM